MGRREIKRAATGKKGKESERGTLGRGKKHFRSSPARPRFFNSPFSLFSLFSRRFPTEGALFKKNLVHATQVNSALSAL